MMLLYDSYVHVQYKLHYFLGQQSIWNYWPKFIIVGAAGEGKLLTLVTYVLYIQ